MGKEVRNYEFKVNNAQVYFNDKGEVKYKGKGDGKKALKQLQPLFDAIAKADTSYKSNDKKVDSAKEKDLMDKLHKLLMADGKVDADELKLGDEFTKSGLSAEAFINKKLEEANPPKKENPVSEEPVDTVVKERTWVDDAREGKLDQPEQVEPETVQEEPVKQEAPARPDPRVSANAYNQTIQNQKIRIQDKREELEAEFTNEQTVTEGTTLYKLAVDALKAEGVEKPNAKQINERIAEIALINNIDNVNNVRVGTTLKVGRGSVPDAGASERVENPTAPAGGAAASSVPATVAPSSIEIYEFNEETLTEAGYTAEEKTVEAEGEEEGFEYKEWSKEESAKKMFTTEIDGVTLTSESLEELKQLRAGYKAEYAKIKGNTEGEDEAAEAKAARQAQNLESMKKLIELSGGNLDDIKNVIELLHCADNVNLESEEVQAFVQDLIRTKNVEVLTALLTQEDGENRVFSPDLLGNNKASAETLASLYKEIRAKENAGEKLTDEEIALKDFFNNTVRQDDASGLYTVEADEENGIIAKEMRVSGILGEPYYKATVGELVLSACDPAILDEFAKEFTAADTDEKKTALFAKYANTDDKLFAQTLAFYADQLKASKDDVLALVAKNDMYVLKELRYTPADTVTDADLEGYESEEKVDGEGDAAFNYTQYTKTEGDVTTTVYVATVGDVKIKADSVEALKTAVAEYKEFNNTVAERVETLYTEAAGDPANMLYLEQAFAKIDATDKSDADKQKLKDKILETYFEVTETTEGEGEDAVTTKHYTFKPSRRPTYEEVYQLYQNTGETVNDFDQAIANAVTLDDMGPGQWAAAIECAAVSREHYAELVADMDAEAILDFVKNKMQKLKDCNIPYDAIIAKFPENLAEQTELVKELLTNVSNDSVMDDANRVKLISAIIDGEGNLKLPEGVTNTNVISALPSNCSADAAKTCFDKVLATLGKDNIDDIKLLAERVTDATSQSAIKTKLTEIVNANKANPDVVLKVMDLGIDAIPDMATFVSLEFTNEAWKSEHKVKVFEKIFNGGILFSQQAEFLEKAVQSGLAVDKGNKIYQVNGTNYGYDTWWGSGNGDARTSSLCKISLNGLDKVDQFFTSPSSGSPNITELLRGTEGDYKNYLNKDNIVTILKAAYNGQKTGIMEQMAGIKTGIFGGDSGTKPGQALMNRVPKAVMRKALEAGLGDSEEYKALANYFGATGTPNYNQDGTIAADDAYKFTQNDDPKGEYTVEQAKALDTLIHKLVAEIVRTGHAV